MAKNIIFGKKAREEVKAGIDKVASAVRTTIGPYGRNVVYEKFGSPVITNDGVSIVREISLEDPFENMGASLIKDVANKTNDVAGDGTSTSVVLAQSLIDKGLSVISPTVNALAVRRGIEKAHNLAKEKLELVKKEVSSSEDILRVATVSAESDEIGKTILETIEKVGRDGVVTVEESRSFGITTDVVDGLEIDKGYISPYMMTAPERMEAEYSDVPILLTDAKITSVKEILPILEKIASSGKKELVIIADDISGEALTTFVLNKLRGTFNVLAIQAPFFGDKKRDALEDIASVVGGKVVSTDKGDKLEDADISSLGTCERIVSSKDKTTIVASPTSSSVSSRISHLKESLKNVDDEMSTSDIEQRIARLSGGVGVIKVGAATESEMKYLKLKIEDAVSATKAAVEEGIVAGGGSTLLFLSDYLSKVEVTLTESEKKGFDVLVSALKEPFTLIVNNAKGDGSGKKIAREVMSLTPFISGYDALEQKTCSDMFASGIIDPVKVTKSSLENAVSLAGIFLTTEVAMTDIPSDTPLPPNLPMGM